MEKRVAVYNNNTGVVETMSSLLAGEGLKMVAVTGRAQLQELLRAQEIQLLLLDVELDGRGWGEGIEMIHDIRNMTTIPVIIISAQDDKCTSRFSLDLYLFLKKPHQGTGDQRNDPACHKRCEKY
jgi:CheY-like chemotaxis protein